MFRRTQDPLKREQIFDYRIITFFDASFQMLRLIYSFVTPYRVSTTPTSKLVGLGSSVSLAATQGIDFLSLPAGTKMFQFSASTFDTLCIYVSIIRHNSYWVPHSEISGSQLTYSSPKHIVVSNVLHRLLVPRHPPCALNNLIYLLSNSTTVG